MNGAQQNVGNVGDTPHPQLVSLFPTFLNFKSIGIHTFFNENLN